MSRRTALIGLKRGGPTIPVAPNVHYDFSDIATLFQAVALATPVTANGQTIKSVKDKSVANEFTLTEATNGPTYTTAAQNGLSCARFDGTNDQLRTAVGEPGADDSFTIFIACKKLSAPDANFDVVFEIDAGASTVGYLGTSTAINGAGDKGSFGSAFTIVPNWVPTAASIVAIRCTNAASVDLYGNGGSPTNYNPDDQLTTDSRYSLGGRAAVGDGWGDYDVYELASFNSALNATDMNLVGNYLELKWNITWNNVS